jgi:hypothetical protein
VGTEVDTVDWSDKAILEKVLKNLENFDLYPRQRVAKIILEISLKDEINIEAVADVLSKRAYLLYEVKYNQKPNEYSKDVLESYIKDFDNSCNEFLKHFISYKTNYLKERCLQKDYVEPLNALIKAVKKADIKITEEIVSLVSKSIYSSLYQKYTTLHKKHSTNITLVLPIILLHSNTVNNVYKVFSKTISTQIIENFIEKLSLEEEFEVWEQECAEKLDEYKKIAKNKLNGFLNIFKGKTNV